jgi:putative copper export protein
MLVKGANRESRGTPRPYVPLGVVAVGLVVAYQAVTDFERLSPTDITLLFLFVFALALFMGLRFFVVDRYDLTADTQPDAARTTEREDTASGAEHAEGTESNVPGSGEERTA